MGCTKSTPENNHQSGGLVMADKKKGRKGGASKMSECKVVILGDKAVGKTSIAVRLKEDKFVNSHLPTIGAQFHQIVQNLKSGNQVKVNLWDTAGEEKFKSMLPMFFKDAKGAILTYDIGSKDTFEHLQDWVEALNDHVDKNNVVIYVVGNKKDLEPHEKQVSQADAQAFARENGMLWGEVSAKTGDGVTEIFQHLSEELAQKYRF